MSSRKVKKSQPGEKRTHRFKPGTKSLRDIRKLKKNYGRYEKGTQKGVRVFAYRPFYRLVREVVQDYITDAKLEKDYVLTLQELSERHLIDLMRASYACAQAANRQSVKPKDFKLAKQLAGF